MNTLLRISLVVAGAFAVIGTCFAQKEDFPRSSVFDSSGNYIVTGGADPNEIVSDPDDRIVTAKYSPSGTLLWSVTYSGGLVSARSVGVDSSGNVYVAGWQNALNVANGRDALLIKYNSSGVQQWVYTSGETRDDEFYDVAVDASGNCYMAGYRDVNAAPPFVHDGRMVKVDTNGSLVWSASDGFSDWVDMWQVELDWAGYAIFAGEHAGGTPNTYVLMVQRKSPTLSGSGQWTWTNFTQEFSNFPQLKLATRTGAGIGSSTPSIYLLATTQKLVGGVFQFSLEYRRFNTKGLLSHTGAPDVTGGSYSGYTGLGGMVCSPTNGIYFACADASGIYVAKVDTNMIFSRTATANALDVSIDSSENVFSVGTLTSAGPSYDITVNKFDSSLTSLTSATINLSQYDKGYLSRVDSSGNVFVSGQTYNGTNNLGFLTAKYNNSLSLQWSDSLFLP